MRIAVFCYFPHAWQYFWFEKVLGQATGNFREKEKHQLLSFENTYMQHYGNSSPQAQNKIKAKVKHQSHGFIGVQSGGRGLQPSPLGFFQWPFSGKKTSNIRASAGENILAGELSPPNETGPVRLQIGLGYV